ncbi:MAG: glutamine--fructose-6-phosphate transaminase (isomerizing) [Clostridia bacterium]|nr:glutamine--fructose-6-phosphate transaminase (isomerizing) [Clostridia bacterium]
MCGIFGYIGQKPAVDQLLLGLKVLEYRGYDSAGIAVLNDKGSINILKREGKIINLLNAFKSLEKNKIYASQCGIGHTRWATHGGVSSNNAHPHISYGGNFAIVHNGIIDNYREIRNMLTNEQHIEFVSQTDSEEIAHLLELEFSKRYSDIIRSESTQRERQKAVLDCINVVADILKGSFAIGVICALTPNCIYAYKNLSPLAVGRNSSGEMYMSSDLPTLCNFCETAYALSDGETAIICKRVAFFDKGIEIQKKPIRLNKEKNTERTSDCKHYMEKEILEIPDAILRTKDKLSLNYMRDTLPWLTKKPETIYFLGCGTAFHACIFASYYTEKICKVYCKAILASEFICQDVKLNDSTVCVFITQSGETADTLQAIRKAKQFGVRTIAITNVALSSICSISDSVVPTMAGVELGVASTKAYNAQLCAVVLLAVYFDICDCIDFRHSNYAEIQSTITDIANRINALNSGKSKIEEIAKTLRRSDRIFFIGRGFDYVTAREGALKLKEISYLYCDGLCGGELKHGTLALISKDVYVVAVATQTDSMKKMYNAVAEVRARGAKCICVSCFEKLNEVSDVFIPIEHVEETMSPIYSIVPLQQLAYLTAVSFSLDPDKPRNLAKSVTVE